MNPDSDTSVTLELSARHWSRKTWFFAGIVAGILFADNIEVIVKTAERLAKL